MREQLTQYVDLLFAGARDCEDIKQEILQNTLDRYDDLVAEGKVPEAAYRLAITGIGDISEILGTKPQSTAPVSTAPASRKEDNDTPTKKLLRAIAVGLYIICPIPMFVLSEFLGMEVVGLCGMLAIVAVATVLIMLGAKKDEKEEEEEKNLTPEQKTVRSLIRTVALGVYLILSIATQAWHITWLVFPIAAAAREVFFAVMDKGGPNQARNLVTAAVWIVGICFYCILSFMTGGWSVTWLVFPITAAARQLAMAILDYKEEKNHET